MSNKLILKIRTHYFFDGIINVKDVDSNVLKIDKKFYKNIDIYYIGYITMKDPDYVKVNNVNPLYLIIDEVDEYVEESNENKYLTFASTDENIRVLKKYAELWNKTKYLIKTINSGKEGKYGKDSMKIKFNSDDNLPLNKIL